jgi:hypothetical protein
VRPEPRGPLGAFDMLFVGVGGPDRLLPPNISNLLGWMPAGVDPGGPDGAADVCCGSCGSRRSSLLISGRDSNWGTLDSLLGPEGTGSEG